MAVRDYSPGDVIYARERETQRAKEEEEEKKTCRVECLL